MIAVSSTSLILAGLPGMAGIMRAMPSTSGSGISIARPTSRMAARAPSVPKVMIWATFSGRSGAWCTPPSDGAHHPDNPDRYRAWKRGLD